MSVGFFLLVFKMCVKCHKVFYRLMTLHCLSVNHENCKSLLKSVTVDKCVQVFFFSFWQVCTQIRHRSSLDVS